jgi:hypothetical protein
MYTASLCIGHKKELLVTEAEAEADEQAGAVEQAKGELVSLLQNLADMDVTYNALQVMSFLPFCSFTFVIWLTQWVWANRFACLFEMSSSNCHGKGKVLKLIMFVFVQETDIGRQVNGLRKHYSAQVKGLVKQLIR